MDIKGINNITGSYYQDNNMSVKENRNKTFENIFESIKNMVSETNAYNNMAREEETAYTMGLKNNTHDLAIAQQKANLSLQYTISIRNHILDAYKEIMNMQF